MMAIAELADQASSSHVAEFFKSSEEKLKAGLEADTRDAVLELMKQSAYNATQLRVVVEILAELIGDAEAMKGVDEKWATSTEPRPDLRDVVIGATSIAPAYGSSRCPRPRL